MKRTKFKSEKQKQTNTKKVIKLGTRGTKSIKEQDNKKYSLEELEECLNERWKRFAYEYCCNGWNKSKAYRKTYPDCSKVTAGINGHQLLKNTKIEQYVEYIKTDYERLCGISKAGQLAFYRRIQQAHVGKLFKNWMELKEWQTVANKYKGAIESIDTKTEHRMNEDKDLIEVRYVKVKLISSLKASERIDKLMGYEAAEKVELKQDINVNIDITQYSPEQKKLLLEIARKNEYQSE